METRQYFLNQSGYSEIIERNRQEKNYTSEEKIVIKDNQECVFIKISNICYIEAAGAYSKIFMENGSTLMVSKNVKALSDRLPNTIFHRVHKSFLININFISRYVKKDGGYIIMENGSTIPVSIRKKDSLSQLMEKLAL